MSTGQNTIQVHSPDVLPITRVLGSLTGLGQPQRARMGFYMASVGQFLREKREEKRMSIAEIARATRVPPASVERIEADQFDELPGEVYVRGFLKSYARAVGVTEDEVLGRYTSSRRIAWVTPLPLPSATKPARGRRVGVAVAFVLLLILFTLALSIVLKPRGGDMPQELSDQRSSPTDTIIHS